MKGSRGEDITFDEVAEHFYLPIVEAASRLGVCNAALKKMCRENGIPRWPYRKIMAGRTVGDIKREAARNLALMRGEGHVAEEEDGGGQGPFSDGTGTPARRGSQRDPSSLVIRIPGPAARGTPAPLAGLKRPVGPAPGALERKPPPIFQSILNQAPANPPSFPFPYPVPISKRHANEQRWRLPSFRQDSKGGAFSLQSSTTHDLWSRGASTTETRAEEGQPALTEGAPAGEGRTGGAAAAPGFEPSVFEALAEVREIRERQASRFSKGMQCSLSRGYALEPRPGDADALRFVFGTYMPKQWDTA